MLKNSNYNNTKETETKRSKRSTLVHPKLPGGGGVTLLQEANGDVPLDGVAFSRMDRL